VTVVSSTSITATTPAHAAGAVNVAVTDSNGNGTLTNGFTYSTGGGSIGFVQVAAVTPQTPQTSVSVAYSKTQTVGNLNVVVVGWNDTSAAVQSVSDSLGNTYSLVTGPLKGTGVTQSIYYAKNIKAGSNTVTVTFSPAAAFPDIRILEYTGLSTTAPLNVTAGAVGTSQANATVSSGSATTTFANELIFGAGTTGGVFSKAGTGFTSEVITSAGDIAEDETVTTTGSYSATGTLGNYTNQNWVMQMVTLEGSSGGGGSAPTVTSISPNSGTTAGGTAVTITGTGFLSGATVTFGGTAATGVTVVSSTSITATNPAYSAGAVNVVVTDSNGSGTSTNGFTYSSTAPQISLLSPASGGIGSGVSILGSNFGSSPGTVTFGGVAPTVNAWLADKIVVTLGSGTPTGNLNVVVTAGGLASNAATFAFGTTPTISQMLPTQGFAGNAVTITGANFGTSQGASTVTFNGMAANAINWSETYFVASVPSNASTGSVVVTINGTPVNAGSFTVTSVFPETASAFAYDSMGRTHLSMACTPLTCGETSTSLQYSYDLAGDLTGTSNGYSDAYYTIGGAGRVTEVTDAFQNVIAENIGYAPTGAMSSLGLGNSLTESAVYNNRLQPCRMNVNSSGTVIATCPPPDTLPSGNVQDFTYGYTPGADNGNLTSFTAVGVQNFSRSYGYDHLNRLQSMSAPGDGCSGLSWNVDPWGNRTNQTVTGGSCFSPALPVNAQNQLSGAPYQYDAAGNLTYDGNHHYTYDAENRVVQVDSGLTANYIYDGSGHRVEKQMPGTISDYLYDDGQISARWTNQGVDHAYVYLGGRLLADYSPPNGALAVNYAHLDHLGSTRLLTNSKQVVTESDDYYPYGESISSGNFEPLKFTGKERDSESGLDNFGARNSASTLGRFMTPDPKITSLRHLLNPQKWNKYPYVLNNPLSLVDPNGQEEMTVVYRAFIPQSNVAYIGPGDNRSFSTQPNASSRISVTMHIETDPAKNHGNPLIGTPDVQIHPTHNNLTGNDTAAVAVQYPTVTPSQDASGNVNLNVQMNVHSGDMPAAMSIRSDVTIGVNETGTQGSVNGTVSGSPAFETNFTPEGAPTTNLPIQGASSLALPFAYHLTQTNTVDKKTPIQQAPQQ
jgi:RHS repeat-associated protein